MFAYLLESKKGGRRSVWGAVASVAGHTAVIAFAVFATAQARVEQPQRDPGIHWIPPRAAPPAAPPALTRRADPTTVRVPKSPPLAIDRIDVVVPPVDLGVTLQPAAPPIGGGFTDNTASTPSATSNVPSIEPLGADQVERQVYLRPGSNPPSYPAALRVSGVEGEVLVLFVVNEAGRVESSTIRFVRSDHVLFERSVHEALRDMRFVPAEVGGRKVRQLVQMPFMFTLDR